MNAGVLRHGEVVIVMGVSGAGKSTIGRALAADADATFLDADDLHSPQAKAAMAAGTPLTDDDRAPWLDRVGRAGRRSAGPVVIACSALRRPYRDRLRDWLPQAAFVHLSVDPDELTRRLHERAHEFMPADLLDSQLQTIEPLHDDELGLVVSATADVIEIVTRIRAWQEEES